MSEKKDFLLLATYVCPSLSVDFYEMLGSYLEAQLGIRTSLLYDSRHSGPNTSKNDHHFIDLAFVSTTTYLQDFCSSNSEYKLLPVGAMFNHPVKGETLGYYTDIVVSRDTSERVKDFSDLHGCSFAFSQESSLSSAKQLLYNLKQMGENASFFSNIIAGGSHVNAIESVIAKKADVATVGSVALSQFRKRHYYLDSQIHLFDSWGPLPPHPIIVNKKLSAEMVHSLEECLLRAHKTPGWRERLRDFSCVQFKSISQDTYLEAQELLDSTKSLSLGVTYY